jgi:hypothetical protein
VRGPAQLYQHEILKDIMMACIILHNMIVEDERDLYLGADEFNYEQITDIPFEPPMKLWTSCKIVIVLETKKHILNSSQTSSSIYGKYIANRKKFLSLNLVSFYLAWKISYPQAFMST